MQYKGNHYKVICVLPAYNAEKTLENTIDDILQGVGNSSKKTNIVLGTAKPSDIIAKENADNETEDGQQESALEKLVAGKNYHSPMKISSNNTPLKTTTINNSSSIYSIYIK